MVDVDEETLENYCLLSVPETVAKKREASDDFSMASSSKIPKK